MTRQETRKPQIKKRRDQLTQQAKREAIAARLEADDVKQYVRRYGWLEIIKKYIERRQNAGFNRPITYLTLPGQDATDIGLLYAENILRRTDDGFPDVAICDNTSAEFVMANLGKFRAVSKKSFCSAVRGPKSDLGMHFPFDVINYDLTHPLIFGDPGPDYEQSHFAAIRWIFRLQRGQSFLLLLTTRPDRNSQELLEPIFRSNIEQEQFKIAYQEQYGSLDLGPCLADFTNFTLIILPKLIARLARDYGYFTYEHFVARYERSSEGRESYDMICHSFEFEPLGRNPAKKYKPRSTTVPVDDAIREEPSKRVKTKAEKAYEAFVSTLPLRDVQDINVVLRSNPQLQKRMQYEATELMGWWDKPKNFLQN